MLLMDQRMTLCQMTFPISQTQTSWMRQRTSGLSRPKNDCDDSDVDGMGDPFSDDPEQEED